MVSPHRYAQQTKQELSKGIVRDAADVMLAMLCREPWALVRIVGDIPRCIPAKYHKLLQEILITSYLNDMYKNASRSFTLAEKHKLLSQALRYTGNVRESAGR